MAETWQIKAALKAILDASGAFGSVYTEDRERAENPNPAWAVMWHDGGSADPGPGRSETSTTQILLSLIIPQPPMNGEGAMQVLGDSMTDQVRRLIRRNPTLDTGAGPLVEGARVTEWDVSYDEKQKRLIVELTVAAVHEED